MSIPEAADGILQPPPGNFRRPAPRTSRLLARELPYRPDGLMMVVGAILLTGVWRIQDVTPGLSPLKLPLLLGIVGVVMMLLETKPARAIKTIASPLTYLVLVLCIQLTIAMAFSLNDARSRSFLIRDFMWSAIAFFLVARSVTTVRDLRWLFALNVVGAAIYSTFVLLRFRALDGSGRLCCTPYYDANDISLVLVATIPLCFYFLRDDATSKVRGRTLLAMLPMLPVFQLAGSRGGFLGLSIVVLLAVFMYRGIKPSKRVWSVVAGMGVLLILGGSSYREKILSIFRPEDDYNVTEEDGRLGMWKNGYALAQQRPWVGYGPRSFPEAYGAFSPRALERGGVPWRAAHNAYVELLAEAGFPAAICFVAMILTAIGVSFRVRSRAANPRLGSDGQQLAMLAQSNALALVAYALTSIFLSSEYLMIIYVMLGLTVVLGKLLADLERKAGAEPVPASGQQMRPTGRAMVPRGRFSAKPA